MSHLLDASRSARSGHAAARRLVRVPIALCALGFLLAGCATPSGAVIAPTPSLTASATATASPTVEPTSSATAPAPQPTDDVVPAPQQTTGSAATVTMVSSGADGRVVYASGLVTGDAGSGGTCTLVATSTDGQVASAEIAAQPTPAAINCGVIEIPVGAGDWSLVLSYRSDTTSASSAPSTVTQP